MNRHGRHGRRGWHGAPWMAELAENMAAMSRGFEEWDDFPFGEVFARRKRRRGRGRMFAGGELRLVLLRLIADEPRHGYELIKAIEELTGGAYSPSPGTIYPTLSLLADEGAIAECIDAGGDASRKAFAATEQGKTELEDKAEEVEALIARLSDIGEQRQRESSPHLHIHRAMENLRNAVRIHRAKGDLEGETLEEIVDAIDEAAKKIERL